MTHRPAPEAGRGPRLVLDDREWLLREGENVLGREDGVTVRITVGGVSRRHARIVVRADQTTVEDLGSKNGTFCGGDRISSPRPLKDGDLIRLGRRVRLVFREMGDGGRTELPTAPDPAGAVFRRDGEYWTAVFEGTTVRLREVQGFPDIARLLARPGAEVHSLELAGRPGDSGGAIRCSTTAPGGRSSRGRASSGSRSKRPPPRTISAAPSGPAKSSIGSPRSCPPRWGSAADRGTSAARRRGRAPP